MQLHKLVQPGGFLCRLLGPFLKTGLLLIQNVLKALAESVLIPLGLTAAASAIDVGIHKKMFGSVITTLIISNEEMNDITKIVKSREKFGLLKKVFTRQLKMKQKNKKESF